MKMNLLAMVLGLAVFGLCVGCSGSISDIVDDITGDVVGDGTPEWDTDGENVCGDGEGCDAEKFCEHICGGGFEFMSCVSVVMQSIPTGNFPRGNKCTEKCDSLMFIYTNMTSQPDYDCLGKAGNCSATAECIGIKQ